MRTYRHGLRFEHEPDGGSDPAGGTATEEMSRQAEEFKRREAELERREQRLLEDTEYLRAVEPYIDDEVRDLIRRKQSGQPAPTPTQNQQTGGPTATDFLGQVRDRAIQRGADRGTAEALVDEFGTLLNTVLGGMRQQQMHEMAELTKKFESSLGNRLDPIESTTALDDYLASDDEVVKNIPRSSLNRSRGEIAAFARSFAQKPKTPEQWDTVIKAWLAPKLADGGLEHLKQQTELGQRAGNVMPPGQSGITRSDVPASRNRKEGERKSWDKELGHSAQRHGFKDLDHLNEVLMGQFRPFRASH